ncbi:hypothetical protein Lalb_Chr21g0310781 [Lupinus albus]|uniref:Uncharacterized protein n=1 Tax=Lupinus albus TaxID=3870 RepID=A0A6A4NSN1_LUPAL|nr:hypothetical protein Lalb_Chr21g0310781 [Lupinus albus]
MLPYIFVSNINRIILCFHAAGVSDSQIVSYNNVPPMKLKILLQPYKYFCP